MGKELEKKALNLINTKNEPRQQTEWASKWIIHLTPRPPNPEPIERNLSYFFPPQLIYKFFITTGFFFMYQRL